VSAVGNISILLGSDDQIIKYLLERTVEPRDILTVAEAAALLRKTGRRLRNWKKASAFPMTKLGGQWIVIRP
jgi:hypothetical protein